MLLFYSLEDRSHLFILAFAGACALGSTVFCRVLGRSASSKLFGRQLRFGDGKLGRRPDRKRLLWTNSGPRNQR
jgi:hypothetical protein